MITYRFLRQYFSQSLSVILACLFLLLLLLLSVHYGAELQAEFRYQEI